VQEKQGRCSFLSEQRRRCTGTTELRSNEDIQAVTMSETEGSEVFEKRGYRRSLGRSCGICRPFELGHSDTRWSSMDGLLNEVAMNGRGADHAVVSESR
jgi:hypothetical protein